MYSLVSAIAKSLTGSQRWATIDISNVPITTLYSQYSRVIATLTNPFLTAPVALDLASIVNGIAGETVTFDQYLTQLGNASLPTYTPVPSIEVQYAEYNDAMLAGYTFTPCQQGIAIDSPLPEGSKPDVYLTKEGVDYNLFYQSCLVSINGYYHLTDTDGNGVYVKNANKNRLHSGKNLAGIVSFRKLGSLQMIPITAQMISKQNSRQELCNHAYVDLGVDLTNSTVILVLGGYMHVLDPQVLFQVNPTTMAIQMNRIPFLDRYYESKEYIDYSSLPLTRNPRSPNQVSITEFYSDANVIAYMTLSQSFFAILNNNEVFVDREVIHNTKIPDVYTAFEYPNFPLIVGAGKHANYWATLEDGQWALNCRDTLRANPVYKTVDSAALQTVTSARNSIFPRRQSQGFFLKIGADYNAASNALL